MLMESPKFCTFNIGGQNYPVLEIYCYGFSHISFQSDWGND